MMGMHTAIGRSLMDLGHLHQSVAGILTTPTSTRIRHLH